MSDTAFARLRHRVDILEPHRLLLHVPAADVREVLDRLEKLEAVRHALDRVEELERAAQAKIPFATTASSGGAA